MSWWKERDPGGLPWGMTKRKCDKCGRECLVGLATMKMKTYLCPGCYHPVARGKEKKGE